MPVIRLGYESMVTPGTVYDYDVATRRDDHAQGAGNPVGLRRGQIRDRAAQDNGARRHRGAGVDRLSRRTSRSDGSRPLFLYAYGAYGYAIPPGFSTGRLSLLDRGFAYAIAHIRGGDDLGQQWYHDGKLEKRANTFNDFVDVAKALVADGWTSAGKIAIAGRSAGGELMGAVVNSDPELWGAVIADVPFVDVLNTMLDESLPLTPGEWPEWGNPIEDKAAFELIRGYSPYDNVTRAGLSADVHLGRAQRPARDLLGAGQMGRQAARDQDRRQCAAAQDQHGRGAWRQVGAVRQPVRKRRGACLRAVAVGRGELMAGLSYPITATEADIDELGHVNNAVWVKWIQDIAVAHWNTIATPEQRDAMIWVVTRHEIDYRGNVSAGETVTAETWVSDPPQGARFDRHVKFTGADGKVKVQAGPPGR